MTQDEIIEMAKLAGFEMDDSCVISPQNLWYIYQTQLEAFAKLVAAKEREACARVCDDIDAEYEGEDVLATWCSKAIRARSGATSRGEA
jgi:hypothetical protein